MISRGVAYVIRDAKRLATGRLVTDNGRGGGSLRTHAMKRPVRHPIIVAPAEDHLAG
jgi:hypothetical protein